MKLKMNFLLISACAVALASDGTKGAFAQEKRTAAPPEMGVSITVAGRAGGEGAARVFAFEGGAVEARLVKDAPFSADTVSETIQTLADGTRIVQRSEGRMVRDSAGRTRNERSFQLPGADERKTSINIFDPSSRTSFFLNPEN